MSWLFSRALVEEYSAGTCLDGEQSAPLSVMPTQHKFWRNDKTMEPSNLSRFGLTCAVLTESRGEDVLTSYLRDFPARTYRSLDQEQVSTEIEADCGQRLGASFAKLSPDLSMWKTPQLSLLEESTEFSGTWPRSGLMLAGECWERQTLAPITSGSVCGFLPTPAAQQYGSNKGGAAGRVGKERFSLNSMARKGMLPTPTVNGNNNRHGITAKAGDGLATRLRRMLPTPKANDYKGSVSPGLAKKRMGESSRGVDLSEFILRDQMLPTPSALQGNQSGRFDEYGGSKNHLRGTELGRGLLNPAWVELFMGWPLGWTDLLAIDDLGEWGSWDEGWADDVSPILPERPDHCRERLTAIGNGQVPLCAAAAFIQLSEGVIHAS